MSAEACTTRMSARMLLVLGIPASGSIAVLPLASVPAAQIPTRRPPSAHLPTSNAPVTSVRRPKLPPECVRVTYWAV